MTNVIQKNKTLKFLLSNIDSLAVAFSGGVDSTFLLTRAHEVIQDKNKLIAITAVSPIHPETDIKVAEAFVKKIGIRHLIIHSTEMDFSEFVANTPERCYVCKKIIFKQIIDVAMAHGIGAVTHGINVDDEKEFRPGMKAARELNIRSPLLDAGLTKHDIRMLSKDMGLSTWDKPASGCLATRIPYGETITLEKLNMIEASEVFLAGQGFSHCRVRHYGEMAKIEVPARDLDRLLNPSTRTLIIDALKKVGFLYVTLDMEGYDSGRLNRSLVSEPDTSNPLTIDANKLTNGIP
ncbi:MAG: ATP-dependent sacrificial sulfur transferase LarE [Dissulfuribacterales bacterium]